MEGCSATRTRGGCSRNRKPSLAVRISNPTSLKSFIRPSYFLAFDVAIVCPGTYDVPHPPPPPPSQRKKPSTSQRYFPSSNLNLVTNPITHRGSLQGLGTALNQWLRNQWLEFRETVRFFFLFIPCTLVTWFRFVFWWFPLVAIGFDFPGNFKKLLDRNNFS